MNSDKDFSFVYGVKIWKQLDLFGSEAEIEILEDGAHIVDKATKKTLCNHTLDYVQKKGKFHSLKTVERRIEGTHPCQKCLEVYKERTSVRVVNQIRVTYETKAEEKTVAAVSPA